MQPTGHTSPQIMEANRQPLPHYYFTSMSQPYNGLPPPGFYSQPAPEHTQCMQNQNVPTQLMYSTLQHPMMVFPHQSSSIPFRGQNSTNYFSSSDQQIPNYFTGGGHSHEVNFQSQYINSNMPPHFVQSRMGAPPQRNFQTSGKASQGQSNIFRSPAAATGSTVRPLSTSTPVPAEIASIPPPMTNQVPRFDNLKSAYLNYHRNMDEDILANLSRISTVTDNEDPNMSWHNSDHLSGRLQHPDRAPTGNGLLTHPFKTRLCIDFKESGKCQAGFNCRFAHGMEELRPPNLIRAIMNPRYKTKMCKNVLSGEYCPYGTRCEFIHPADAEFDQAKPNADNSVSNNASSESDEGIVDITPELRAMALPPMVTRSAFKEQNRYESIARREVTRSLMCLTSLIREESSDRSSAFGSGSGDRNVNKNARKDMRKSCGNLRAVPSMQNLASNSHVPLKFLRRRSMSQSQVNLNKKWNSNEKLADVSS